MSNDDPLIYYQRGETTLWKLSGSLIPAGSLKKAVARLCKKMKVPVPDVPNFYIAERFALYHSPKHSPTNIMCGEETNESLFGIREIDFFEDGDWLIQYCPFGKTFFSNGHSFNGDSLADVFEKFNEYLKEEE